MNPRTRFLLALVFTFLMGCGLFTPALAHGPFDNSSRLYVLDEHLELALTVGMDGARQILSNAGMSAEESAKLLAVSGPGSFRDAPAALATRLFELKAGPEILNAKKLKVFTDGLEANFTIEYPRTTNAVLAVEARYFGGIAPLLAGALVVTDENGNVLGSAELSKANVTALVAIARPLTGSNAEPAIIISNAVATGNEPIHVSLAADLPPRTEKSSSPLLGWCAAGLAILAAVWLIVKIILRR